MIRVYHWSHDVNVDVQWDVKDALIGEDTHYQACYFAGLNSPNYPLPSIYCLSLISDKVDERSWEACALDFVLSLVR